MLNLRFPGQYYDAETNTNYNIFRTFDPPIGRFDQPDPSGFNGGIGLYVYGLNSPLMYVDPSGLDSYAPSLYPTGTFSPPEPLPAPVYNFLMGAADDLSFRIGPLLRSEYGMDAGIDPCSTAYKAGEYASLAVGLGRLGYAGAAKIVSNAAVDGVAANAGRNALKVIFRGGLFSNSGMPSYEALLAEKGSDAAVKAAAGRTSPFFNSIGADAAGGYAVNQSKCGCK